MYIIESDPEMTDSINAEIKDLRQKLADALDHNKRLEAQVEAMDQPVLVWLDDGTVVDPDDPEPIDCEVVWTAGPWDEDE